jgi:hypothetical protein
MAMTTYLKVQASAAMFSTIKPEGWGAVFGVHVTDQAGVPVTGLKKANFTVWEITTIGPIDVVLVTELNLTFPTSKMPGIYRVQTMDFLGLQSQSPQQFVHAIRVGYTRRKNEFLGSTTTAVTFLGNPQ